MTDTKSKNQEAQKVLGGIKCKTKPNPTPAYQTTESQRLKPLKEARGRKKDPYLGGKDKNYIQLFLKLCREWNEMLKSLKRGAKISPT